MRRKLAVLFLSLFLVAGVGESFAQRNDGRGGKDRQEQRGHRPGNSGNRNHNSGKNNGGKRDKENKHGNMNQGRPGGNNGHGNMNQGRPGGNNGHGNMNQGRPGGNNGHGNMNQGRPGGNHNDKYRPGGHSRPGGSHPGPGHVGAPHPGVPHPGGPAPAPVVRPGMGFSYGPALPPPPPRLPYMVNFATRGCRDVNVWQIDAETFIVKYRRGGRWYTQYLYPYVEEYSRPTLISVNWQPLSPWSLIPPIQLNINL